ncbi:hypothetical protein M231_01529 [Tremella mesenterica]|uniref:Pinin/SDK/MemA protein domain-containing protein n=1 Tax=Tremella mesenterica TaxID=5217 RepID=A0A4Q1BT09_TREME|nr:hypothetical protein M231_01529 [Tremella mesenterica]
MTSAPRGTQDMEEKPAKRMKIDSRQEDTARSRRMFGNLLGTLQKFKKEDKTSRTSDAAKRREQVSERIASKIRTENSLNQEIADNERELKTLRIQTGSVEFVLNHKQAAMTARHAFLLPTSKFLFTSLPTPSEPLFQGNLLDPSPIPLASGPSRQPPSPAQLKPLYFLPKILLPEQEEELNIRIKNIDELVKAEADDLAKEEEKTRTTAAENRRRMEELTDKLTELRRKVRPEGLVEKDDFGRTPREQMEVDRDREISIKREEGVQIRGENGDVEVEY